MNSDSSVFHTQKAVKSLTWDVCFFVISINLLMFAHMFFSSVFKQNLHILSPPLTLWNSSSELSNRLSHGVWSSVSSPNKTIQEGGSRERGHMSTEAHSC